MPRQPKLPVGPAGGSAARAVPGIGHASAAAMAALSASAPRGGIARHYGRRCAATDTIWAYLSGRPPLPIRPSFERHIAACEENKERIFYAVVDAGGPAGGSASSR